MRVSGIINLQVLYRHVILREDTSGQSERKEVPVRFLQKTFAPLRSFDQLLAVLRLMANVSTAQQQTNRVNKVIHSK